MYEDGAVHSDAARKVQYFFFFPFGPAGLGIHHETAHTRGTLTDSFIVTQTAGYMICHSLAKLVYTLKLSCSHVVL